MNPKIALEEHVSTKLNNTLWDSAGEADRNGEAYMGDVEAKLLDTDERIELMDTYGIETTILSLTSPGIQAILDIEQAAETARESNDTVRAQYVDAYPSRLAFFAAVAMQDPERAPAELERAVTELGANGALLNGYTNIGDHDTGRYLHDPGTLPLRE